MIDREELLTFMTERLMELPQMVRGRVWCRYCGATQRVNSRECLRVGWPKCCGYTMTLDSPSEQYQLAGAERES